MYVITCPVLHQWANEVGVTVQKFGSHCVIQANLDDTDLADESNSMAADLPLQFSPGLSAGLSSGLSAALFGASPIDPGQHAAAPRALEETDVATKKRKMREAEQQPLLQLGQSPLTQVKRNCAHRKGVAHLSTITAQPRLLIASKMHTIQHCVVSVLTESSVLCTR